MSSSSHSWQESNTFHHRQFDMRSLAAQRDGTISVCLPARNEERTIGGILERLVPLLELGLIDQVAVVDGSSDRTAAIAGSLGAEVYGQERLMPELGGALGKGDAMWRALQILRGDYVCFLDADSEQFGSHFVTGLLGPLLTRPEIALVKGFYRRPFRVGDVTLPDEGGRVTELMARPLLRAFYPELASIEQPLAGELAARRELLVQLPFVTGYGVDIALLIDAYRSAGLTALAQVDLEERQNDHQPLRELGSMASSVLEAVSSRLIREGRLRAPLPEMVERPPVKSLQPDDSQAAQKARQDAERAA
jgi:glucosyl-3-phosphoglycerate synthase